MISCLQILFFKVMVFEVRIGCPTGSVERSADRKACL